MSHNIKIHILKCGNVLVDSAVPFRNVSRNPLAYTGILRSKKHKVWLPVFTYLIEHPKGRVLVDTSWSEGVRYNSIKELGFTLNFSGKPLLPSGESVLEHLASKGLSAVDLDYVFLTHLDADHVSGLKDLRGAPRFIVNEKELNNIGNNLRYNSNLWKGIDIKPIKLHESEHGPYNLSYDLFKDNTVILVWLPGHSEGMTGVLIQNNGKFILIAGDCGYSPRSWKELELPGVMDDKQKMLKCLKWINNISKYPNCINVFVSHDNSVQSQILYI